MEVDSASGDQDNSINSDDLEMSTTIDSAKEGIQPILNIFKNAWIHDVREGETRQLDYSVKEFMKAFPDIRAQNFYEKSNELDRKIKDARCFFMLVRQLHPNSSRSVSTQNKKLLSLYIYICVCVYIYYIYIHISSLLLMVYTIATNCSEFNVEIGRWTG
jgi:hypothetical protein